MALTHVCIWKEGSWKKININEASRLFPYGVSANSGILMCELCGQYVTLTKRGIYSSYFKHNSKEKNKECAERSQLYAAGNIFQAEAHNLPIKISVQPSNKFSLSLGLISLPHDMRKGKANYKIGISGSENFTYLFSRLNSYTITYLDIGTKPALKYQVNVTPKIDGIRSYWPSEILGIDPDGTLFDKATGKKLPYDADVQVGYDYLLLKRGYIHGSAQSVYIKEICTHTEGGQKWKVYEVRAIDLNEKAAKFFLDFHCRLTDEPVTMYPVWPLYIESPYVIYHKSKQINIYFKGNAIAKLAPVGSIRKYPYTAPKLLSITSSDRQQLLSAGRTEVLKYMYFWEAELNKKGILPLAKVCNIAGEDIESGIQQNLPEKNTICIIPEVDGLLKIYRENIVIEQYNLSADSRFEYDGLQYGITAKIFQGLDCVWTATYEKKKILIEPDDIELLLRLKSMNGNEIEVNHTLGAIANKFDKKSPVRIWVYEQIRRGKISENALKYLCKCISEKRQRG